MRLKTFQAPNMSEAMKLVRDELGEDAIIVSTTDNGSNGVRITAAVETPDLDLDFAETISESNAIDQICDALERHGTPQTVTDRLLNTATTLASNDTIQTLAGALDLVFEFSTSDEPTDRPIMLFGPPGAGKTSAVAKLAARAVVNRTPVTLVTTDTLRAGAVPQIEAYGECLNLPVKTAKSPAELSSVVDSVAPDQLVLIDTTSVNPYASEDLERLSAYADAIDAERLLTINAGRDALEAREIATAFQAIGPRRLVFTGMDMSRRLGSLLAIADASQAAFSEMSHTPEIVDGIHRINPVKLARLLLEHVHISTSQNERRPDLGVTDRQATSWK